MSGRFAEEKHWIASVQRNVVNSHDQRKYGFFIERLSSRMVVEVERGRCPAFGGGFDGRREIQCTQVCYVFCV